MNNEIQKLVEKAERSLAAAGRLLDDGDYDFSVSRSYYAMFYAATAVLLAKGLSFSSHSAVISGFYEHLVKSGLFSKELHKSFHHAFLLRQEGDYICAPVITKDVSQKLLDDTAVFVEKLTEAIFKSLA